MIVVDTVRWYEDREPHRQAKITIQDEVLSCLVGKCACILTKEKAIPFFNPFQYGVAYSMCFIVE